MHDLIRWTVFELPDFAADFEWTDDRTWLTRTAVCNRGGFLGVPLSHADVLVQAELTDPAFVTPEGKSIVLEFTSTKTGRYSGMTRDRWCFRVMEQRHAGPIAIFGLHRLAGDTPADRRTVVRVRDTAGGLLCRREYRTLPWEWDPKDSGKVLLWQANRYFRFLPEADVRALAATYTLGNSPRSKSGANQLAARALYRLARELGWRKMTLRERVKAWGPVDGPDRPCWVRADDVPQRRNPSRTGCGEATIRAAGGGGFEPVVYRIYSGEDDG